MTGTPRGGGTASWPGGAAGSRRGRHGAWRRLHCYVVGAAMPALPAHYPCRSIRYSRRLAGRGVPRGKGSPSPADSDDRPSVTRRVAWANRWRSFGEMTTLADYS